ncbi:hypothetical protein ACQEVG_33000 [Streptomyces sp. CA-135486]|uniref:hypothetical protein n=1 Tax=Streptomyces sp. CA-135486 TaxID=3240049 RepID=UPI003D901F6F
MTPLTGIVQEITVSAINVLAGDEFERHGKTWTAKCNARHEGRWTARIAAEGGGVLFITTDTEIIVRRVVQRREKPACATD